MITFKFGGIKNSGIPKWADAGKISISERKQRSSMVGEMGGISHMKPRDKYYRPFLRRAVSTCGWVRHGLFISETHINETNVFYPNKWTKECVFYSLTLELK